MKSVKVALLTAGVSLMAMTVVSQKNDKGYKFNQNYQVQEYLKDGKKFKGCRFDQYNLNWPTMKCGRDYTLTIIDMGMTDAQGYPLKKLMLTAPKKLISKEDTIYMIPNNIFYPTHYKAYQYDYDHNEYDKFGTFIIDGAKGFYEVGAGMDESGKNYIYIEDKGFKVFTGSGDGLYKDHKAIREDLGLNYQPSYNYGGTSSINANEYVGIGEYTKYRNQYHDSLVNVAKSKSITTMYENISDNSYRYRQMGNWPPIDSDARFKFIMKKDASGIITELIMHKAFTDGKYYDKDKFYIKTTQLPNGVFQIISEDKGINGRILLPYGRFLLFGHISSGGAPSINGVLTDENEVYGFEYEPWGINICSGSYSDLGGDTSHPFWCKQEFEERYDENKDPYQFRNWLKTYYSSLRK